MTPLHDQDGVTGLSREGLSCSFGTGQELRDGATTLPWGTCLAARCPAEDRTTFTCQLWRDDPLRRPVRWQLALGKQCVEQLMQTASGARCPPQDMFYSPWALSPASIAAAWLVAMPTADQRAAASQDRIARRPNEQGK